MLSCVRRVSVSARGSVRALSSLSGNDAVIVSAARTPIGSISSSLASVSATKLGSIAIEGALKKAGINPEIVDESFMGNVVSANLGQAPARQAGLGAGLPLSVPHTTINKVCASGMKAVMFAAQSIELGQNSTVVAGGMESMSNIPHYIPSGRTGIRFGHGQMLDGLIKDGLWDVYNDFHMGNCGEKCAADLGITREEQDAYAIRSYQRAQAASEGGLFDNEIVPVELPQRRGDPKVVSVDEEFTRVNFDKVSSLRPAFKKDGTVTAANASTLNDGAAALIVMSAAKAAEVGATPLARIRGYGDAAQAPEDFTTAPSLAVPVALRRAGVTGADIDYHEINEAFSVVVLANQRILEIDPERINVNGGGVALGHPIGCSGARIIGTLYNVLAQKDATLGCASICNGGGGASAIVIERLN